jgi:hypothetical protein
MNINKFAKIISGVAILLAILHILSPTLGIDAILISLLVIAVLPWIIPFLKTLELPGGVKIEFRDVKEATDKISVFEREKEAEILETAELFEVIIAEEEQDTFRVLHHIAEIDPNLCLVGFRIEIEKRLLRLAEQNDIDTYRRPLYSIVEVLIKRKMLPGPVASGLNDLIAMGNSAAHGANVSPDAAKLVLEVGPSILKTLDSLIEPQQDKLKK